MKRWVAFASAAVVASSSVFALAADEAPAPKAERPNREAMMKQLLEKFDADKDGKLSPEELAKARESMRGQRPAGGPGAAGGERFAELMKKYDKDGDGKLSDEERTAMRAELGNRGGRPAGERTRPDMAELLKKFDKDGDGKLNDEERAAARASMPKRTPRGEKKADPKPEAKPAE